MDKTPAYARVYNQLRRQIIEGEYGIGELLPTEPELEKMFSVSRTTVRRAVDILSREGFLRTKQGRGTEVLNYNTQQNLNTVTSLTETLERKGYRVYAKSMHIDYVEAFPKIAAALRIEPGQKVVRIQRIQMADESPIAIMYNYIRCELVPNIEKFSGKFSSLYAFLEEHYGIVLDSAVDHITARTATFEEAEMLGVPVGTALVYMMRTCFRQDNVVCADRVKIIAGRYEFEIHMRGRFERS
ncbi:GntR family transcriptional regulator [Bacillota bacterium Meth-B3]|nr:GntR family transcriptional regulator [Christensenellaceae bacterium]MEA5064836.1 GntR family transcriptional regulator [Eubacteriales bacterium]